MGAKQERRLSEQYIMRKAELALEYEHKTGMTLPIATITQLTRGQLEAMIRKATAKPKRSITKRMRDIWVTALQEQDEIDFAHMPVRMFRFDMLTPRTLKEALDWYVADTVEQIPRLECIESGPIPKYKWVREEHTHE